MDTAKTAIIALSRNGITLGHKIKTGLGGAVLYAPQKHAESAGADVAFSQPVSQIIRQAFSQYRQIVLIMASGIGIRALAPVIQDKRHDPAVVLLDEQGNFAVSLLSGHLGGANKLARRLALICRGQAVITTASDVQHTLSPDLLGKEYGWKIQNPENLTALSGLVVNGQPVGIYQSAGENLLKGELAPNLKRFSSLEELYKAHCPGNIFITEQELSRNLSPLSLIYRPPCLVVGIGCNRGTAASEIEQAVFDTLSRFHLSCLCLSDIASVDLKSDEAGLREFARSEGLNISFFSGSELAGVDVPSAPSQAAMRCAGTPSVAEAAALLCSKGEIVVPKQVYRPNITVAVALKPAVMPAEPSAGWLYIVGIGPGNPDHLTPAALEAITNSQVIVGYKTYTDQIAGLINGKELISTGMTQEIQRAEKAIMLALEGKKVALVSGGDSGIFGMSGLVYDILRERQITGLKPKVISGMPALVSCSSLLGAPLMTNFSVISLSNYLTAWTEIETQLRACAATDLVMVIQNPTSKKRGEIFALACRILLEYRRPETVVGIVKNADRPEQEYWISSLGNLAEEDIDMNTTIIIGNSYSYRWGESMVTPRGYANKYQLV